MKTQAKSLIYGIIISLLFIPLLLTFFLSTEGRVDWRIPCGLFGVLIGSHFALRKILGSDVALSPWKEEGYTNKMTWIKESDSPLATQTRNQLSKNGWKMSCVGVAVAIIIVIALNLIGIT